MANDSTSYGSFCPFIEGADYPLSDDFSQTLASADNLHCDAYINQLLGEDYHCPPLQSTDFADGNLPLERPPVETRKSAFTRYNRQSLFIGLQSAQEKQQSIKRCLDFIRKMDKSTRCRSNWDDSANARMVEESNAYTHMMAERKRRDKLNQQFMALRSLLPKNSKRDRHSILSDAILQLKHLKSCKEDLEQKNKALLDMYRRSTIEGYSSSSLDCGRAVSGAGASTTDVMMRCVSDEAVVVFEKSNIPDEDNLQVTLKRKKASTHIDVILSLLKCLRELKLEVVRSETRNSDSVTRLIQATICTRTKGKEWQIFQKKYVEDAVKRALHLL